MGFVAVIAQIGRYLLHEMGMFMAYLLIAVMTFLLTFSPAYIATHEVIME